MKKKFLKDLGIADEAIEKIMAEISADSKAFSDAEENYKKEIERLNGDLTVAQGEAENLKGKIEKMNFDFKLSSELSRTGVKNVKAITGFLDFEKLSLENGRVAGLEEQIKVIKEENPYLFGNEPTSTGMAQGSGISLDDGFMKNLRSAAGV